MEEKPAPSLPPGAEKFGSPVSFDYHVSGNFDWTGKTGDDGYYIDETGILRHSGRPDVPATASSPPLEEKK